MPRAKQTNQIARTIDDQREEIRYVATEHTHIQGFEYRAPATFEIRSTFSRGI